LRKPLRLSKKSMKPEPLAKVLPFMVRYLTTNGESAIYNPTTPFALRYRRARREFCKRLTIEELFQLRDAVKPNSC